MTYYYTAGEQAELLVGEHVEPVTVEGVALGASYWVTDSAGRRHAVRRETLRPVLPGPNVIEDHNGDRIFVGLTPSRAYVRINCTGDVDLTPDQADDHARAVAAMARAIRARQETP